MHRHYGVEPMITPQTKYEITLPRPVKPWAYWLANFGYCSETVILQAGLNAGQFMSAYNVRKLSRSGHGQSGGVGWCQEHKNVTNYNAQTGLEIPGTGTSGPMPFANIGQTAGNQRLDVNVFNPMAAPDGMAGYRHFLSWVKGEFLKGRPVAIGLLMDGPGGDQQYDHVVNVQAIGTNHHPFTAEYYDDDVLVFDDNGALSAGDYGTDPDCFPYYYRYTFKSLAQPGAGRGFTNENIWGLAVPSHTGSVETKAGSDGINPVLVKGPHNFGWSSKGPIDLDGDLLPISVVVTSSSTRGQPNEPRPFAGFNYENNLWYWTFDDCVEDAPDHWMTVTLAATVSGLTVGETYNLYRYVLEVDDSNNPINVPVAHFNAEAKKRNDVTPVQFTAVGTTFTSTLTTTSDKAVFFRCVLASAR